MNMPLHPVVQWLAVAVLSGLLTGFFTWYTRRRGMLDIPAERHSHTEPTPRGGGAGIVVAVIVASLWTATGSALMQFWKHCFLPAFVVLGLMGWRDDRMSLSARVRFSVQVLVSFTMLWCLRVHFGGIAVMPLALAGLYVLWVTNLYNFMDGSNGMAGFQGVFAGLMLAWLYHAANEPQAALISSLLAAACIGFLPWNLGRARVFMGDVASGALGFAFASLLVYGIFSGGLSLPVAWLVMLVFVCDTTLTLLCRVMRGERWYTPHKQHLYQRLIAYGWSHGSVLLLYQAVNLIVVAPAIAVAVNFPALSTVVACSVTLVLIAAWSLVIQKLGVLAQAG